ncbi:MAG: MarR family winged helix-turn-helix transcriptional regulator [Candidatus Bipolaricaulia bacterium]
MSTANSEPRAEAEDLRLRLVERFERFGPAHWRWMHSRMQDSGITHARMRLLAVLQDNNPQIMSDLSDELCVTPRNVTALVDGLEDEGLVRRRPHPTDRRATLIELTPQGTEACTHIYTHYVTAVAELFDDLSEADQRELIRLLDLLLVALQHRGII